MARVEADTARAYLPPQNQRRPQTISPPLQREKNHTWLKRTTFRKSVRRMNGPNRYQAGCKGSGVAAISHLPYRESKRSAKAYHMPNRANQLRVRDPLLFFSSCIMVSLSLGHVRRSRQVVSSAAAGRSLEPEGQVYDAPVRVIRVNCAWPVRYLIRFSCFACETTSATFRENRHVQTRSPSCISIALPRQWRKVRLSESQI